MYDFCNAQFLAQLNAIKDFCNRNIYLNMKKEKSMETKDLNLDQEIKLFIEKKKQENSALKKLLSALDDAKKNSNKKFD